jgi:hypothetical protein
VRLDELPAAVRAGSSLHHSIIRCLPVLHSLHAADLYIALLSALASHTLSMSSFVSAAREDAGRDGALECVECT